MLAALPFDALSHDDLLALGSSISKLQYKEMNQHSVQEAGRVRGSGDSFWQELTVQLLVRGMHKCLSGYTWLWGSPSFLQWVVPANSLIDMHPGRESVYSGSSVTVDGGRLRLEMQYDADTGSVP